MKPEEQFDDLFSKRFNEGEFPFDENHWKQAEQLIAAHERKKRRRIAAIIFTALLFSISGILYLMNVSENQTNEAITVSKSEKKSETQNFESENKSSSIQNKNINQLNNSPEVVSIDESKNNISEDVSFQNTSSSKNKKQFTSKTNSKHLQNQSSNLISNNSSSELIPNINNATNEIVNQQEENNSSVENENSNPILIPDVNSIAAETTATATVTPPAIIPLAENKKKNQLSIAGGAIAFQNFKGNMNASSGFTLNPFAEISYEHFFNEHWSSNIGAAYFQHSKINSQKEFASVYYNYEFGVRDETVLIKNKKLQYISVPFSASYHFNKTQSLFAGLNFSYLLNTKSDVVNSTTKDNSSISATSNKVNGYVNGFEKIDFALLAGYEQGIFKNAYALIHLQYGLKDVTKNNYFNNSVKDKNIGIAVGLKYNLISK